MFTHKINNPPYPRSGSHRVRNTQTIRGVFESVIHRVFAVQKLRISLSQAPATSRRWPTYSRCNGSSRCSATVFRSTPSSGSGTWYSSRVARCCWKPHWPSGTRYLSKLTTQINSPQNARHFRDYWTPISLRNFLRKTKAINPLTLYIFMPSVFSSRRCTPDCSGLRHLLLHYPDDLWSFSIPFKKTKLYCS